MSSNLTQEQLEERARNLVFSGHDQGFGSDISATAANLVSGGDEDGNEGLRASVAVSSLQGLANPRRLSTGSGSRATVDSSSGDDDADAEPSDGKGGRGAAKWFDVASETQKFKRRVETLCTRMKTRMNQLSQQMQDQLDVSRNMAHVDLVETKIVHHRLRALRIIASGEQAEYSTYLEAIAATLVLRLRGLVSFCAHVSWPFPCSAFIAFISGRCRTQRVSTRQEVQMISC